MRVSSIGPCFEYLTSCLASCGVHEVDCMGDGVLLLSEWVLHVI